MKIKFNYTFDTCDWPCEEDREKCEVALGEWFENLSEKTKLAIYYSECLMDADIGIDTTNQCPWNRMLFDAEIRIKERYAPYSLSLTGHNLFLSFQSIEVITEEIQGVFPLANYIKPIGKEEVQA